jgi:hypothetical protein
VAGLTLPEAPRPALGRFIAASGLANLADGVAVVAWAWVATLLTRDALLIAMMPVALRLPWAIFALPAGIVTDRVDRRRLILAMDGLRAFAFALAAVALWQALPLVQPPDRGVAEPTLFAALLLCALVVGCAEVFRDNAAQTMLPSVVPHADLERANGRLWSVELVGNALVGPALGAFLVAAAAPLPFAVNAVAFVLAVLLMAGLRGQFRAPVAAAGALARKEATRRNWRRELAEGFAFLRGAPTLRLLAWITGIWNLLHQMILVALLLHVQENLGLGARSYGLILAAGAVGGIAGGFLAARVVARMGPGAAAQWMTLASAVAFLALPLWPSGLWIAAVLAAFEFTGIIWNTVSVSYRQRTIPDALLGRVNSLYRLLAWGMMPVGLVLSGLIVRGATPEVGRALALLLPFFAAAAGAGLLTLVAWRPLGTAFDAPATPPRDGSGG